MDRFEQRRLDAYLTKGPPDPEEPRDLRCTNCTALLPEAPTSAESWEDAYTCSGQVRYVTQTYEAENDSGILDIIGWEHLGGRFEVDIAAACGDPEPHEPHKVVNMDGILEHRTCPACHQDNVEVLI
jgi:hypothetical protein